MKTICIFCGSSKGNDPIYEQIAYKYTSLLAKEGIRIIYGGGSIGIMGVVSKACKENNGYIIGVAPDFLKEREVLDKEANELIIVKDMFERKMVLINKADAFAILPGGIGTLDEFFEVLTALQLEIMNKPVGILNVNGYYNHLIEMLQTMVEKRFYRKEHFDNIIIENTPEEFHKNLMCHSPERVENWVEELKENEHF